MPELSDRVRGRMRGLVRGDTRDASWVRPALIALLVITATAYVWDLSSSGYANTFYAAAVQAGTKSWKAFFFGSLDSSSFITVDKPPASLWVMALSARIFGFSSLSMLIPQVLEGVLAVVLLYAAVKRWFGPGAGLLAGALLAVTPVAALMFRFNNPDALLVCLLVAGAYCLVRAIEGASTRWIVAAGTMIGFAFLAKMAQAFLVLPAFGLVYLVAAPTGLRRRLLQLLAGGLAVVISAGWWVAIVAVRPVSSRPMIDGSPTNNIFNLITGYNGLGRIFGASGGAGGGGANFSGSTGALRLFNSLMGGQASWLLPAALLGLTVGLWMTRRAPRTDRTRAALLLWGGWLIVSAVVFSFGSGTIHTYYTVALAPAIAALVAIPATLLWRTRASTGPRATMALLVAITATWSWILLDRPPQWEPWVRWLVLVTAALTIAGVLAAPLLRRLGHRALLAGAVLATVACLSGPVAYSAQTITTTHTGSTPTAGPSAQIGMAGMGSSISGHTATTRVGAAQSGTHSAGLTSGKSSIASTSTAGAGGQTKASSALVKALKAGSGNYRWVAAVSGSQSAASFELATGGTPVMAIGGFDNEGGNLTLAQFKQYVARGDIHYYIATSNGVGQMGATTGQAGDSASSSSGAAGSHPATTGGPKAAQTSGRSGSVHSGHGQSAAGGAQGGSTSSAITAWVKANYKSTTIGGQTVYDLSQTVGS